MFNANSFTVNKNRAIDNINSSTHWVKATGAKKMLHHRETGVTISGEL